MSVNEKMTAIADAIRDKTGGAEALTLDDMAAEIPKVYEEGKKAEYDAFWDAYQSNGRETGRIYSNAFSYYRFNDETYNPKYDIICQTGITPADMLFYRSGLTSTKVPIYILGSRMSQSFGYNPQLVSIPYLHVNESMTFAGNPFQECSALETLIMGGTIGTNGLNLQWSPKLNKASIESIINALSATTSGLTVTLSKTAVNNAFGIDIDDESTWTFEWLALRGTKSNWTFNYV